MVLGSTRTMKKILYLITSSEFGGAQKYVFDLAVNLPPAQYRAVVAAGWAEGAVSAAGGALFSRLADFPNIKTVKIFNLKRLPRPLAAWRCLKEILKLLNQENPTVLHLNSTVAGCLGSLAAKIYKKKTKATLKVIYTVHGWVFLEPGFIKSRIYFLAEKISAKWKDLFIVLSERDLQVGIRKKIAPQSKFIKIYNGLNEEALHFLPPEEAKKILPDDCRKNNIPIIGTIANFYPTKGLPFLIEAARILVKIKPSPNLSRSAQIRRWFFVIIGDGPKRKNLEKQIAQANLKENIFLAGRISSGARYLKAFDIFVLPSVKEGLPWVILEAMAAEVPIIATNVGGVPELIENEKSGLLVEPKNPTALAGAIEDLLNNPTQQKSLAHEAKQRITKFSLSQMLSQTYSLY